MQRVGGTNTWSWQHMRWNPFKVALLPKVPPSRVPLHYQESRPHSVICSSLNWTTDPFPAHTHGEAYSHLWALYIFQLVSNALHAILHFVLLPKSLRKAYLLVWNLTLLLSFVSIRIWRQVTIPYTHTGQFIPIFGPFIFHPVSNVLQAILQVVSLWLNTACFADFYSSAPLWNSSSDTLDKHSLIQTHSLRQALAHPDRPS